MPKDLSTQKVERVTGVVGWEWPGLGEPWPDGLAYRTFGNLLLNFNETLLKSHSACRPDWSFTKRSLASFTFEARKVEPPRTLARAPQLTSVGVVDDHHLLVPSLDLLQVAGALELENVECFLVGHGFEEGPWKALPDP